MKANYSEQLTFLETKGSRPMKASLFIPGAYGLLILWRPIVLPCPDES